MHHVPHPADRAWPASRAFWLQWMAATAVGLAAGMATLFAGLGAALRTAPPLLFGVVLGSVLGTACGTAQWLVLRRRVRGAGMWVPATVAAWALFWALNMAGAFGQGSGVGGRVLEGLGHGALFGGLLGVAQWWVLRGTARGARWWVPASVVGWAVSAALGDGLKAALGGEGPIDLAVGLAAGAAVTGACLGRLLRDDRAPAGG